MILDDLLSELGARGICLRRDGEALKIRGNAEALEPSLVADLRSHKAALLNLVGAATGEWWSPPVRITPAMLPLVELTQAEIDAVVASVPGGAGNVADIYPLAPLQEGVHFHHMLSEAADPYLMAVVYEFDSRERLDAFVSAYQNVIDRHDILRTSVVWEGLPEPVQVVWRRADLPVEEVALHPDGGDAVAQLRARANPRRRRFDLHRAPLLQALVGFQPRQSRWLMVMLLHHLAGDHTTLEVIHHEVRAFLTGRGDELPAPVPFRNFVAQVRQGMTAAEHEAFFASMLADIDEPTAPLGTTAVQGDGSGITEARAGLPEEASARLRRQARLMGVSVAGMCHLAWAMVLARLTGRDDVVFGTVLFGRMHSGGGQTVGPLFNTLPLRLSISGSVEGGVRAAQSALAALLRHEHASLALAQRCSGVPAPSPLFTSLFNFRHSSASGENGGGLPGVRLLGGEERTNYPLTVSVDDLGTEFRLTVQAVGSLDPARIGGYLCRALSELVRALGEEPGRPLASLDVLPAGERDLVLRGWNDTAAPFPDEACLHELFEAQAARTPDAVAVACGDERLTYAELDARANGLALRLRGLGVRPDDRIAVCAGRGVPMIVALLGTLKAGGAYVPLDPSYPDGRLRFMVADSAPVALLVDGAAPGWAGGLVTVDVTQPHPGDPGRSDGLTPRHLAYVIYTSGSTGQPKGVMVEHRSAVASTFARSMVYPAPRRFLLVSSFSFDSSVAGIFGTLTRGGMLVVADADTARDPRAVAGELVRHGVDSLLCVPSLYRRVLGEIPGGPPLTRVIVAGEPCPPALVAASLRAGIALFNEYGPTEATVWSTVHRCAVGDDPVPIGRPVPNARVYVLDGRGEPAPVGVAGELCVGGAGVARGYLNRPEMTAERFVADRFSGGRMYRTGDLARWLADGSLEFLGRDDHQVKLRGYRVELGEIEARLASGEGVRECAVAVRGDALVAYYAGDQASPESLRALLAGALPDYMVPAAFVRLGALPLTPNGKLDRSALPAPGDDALARQEYEAPRGQAETTLAGIWSQLLRVDRVGRQDNFFDLGGHSLHGVRLVSRLRVALGVDLPLSKVFATPVLADLALLVAASVPARRPPITPRPPDGAAPVSFAQQRLWFLSQVPGVSRAYHIPTGLRLRGDLDSAVLRQALDRVVARHEALRTTFGLAGGEPVQLIGPGSAGWAEYDAAGRPGERDRLVTDAATAPFDLVHGPLIRACLIRDGDREYTFVLTMHHIVSDGWSMGILIDELSALYAAFSRGEPDPLPPLAVQYADYAVWQRQWLAGEELQRQGEYWAQALAGAPALCELPTDWPRPAQQDFAGGFAECALDAELTGRLKELSRRQGVTLFATLLASWAALISRLSGTGDVVIGTATANRGQGEIEHLIGFFVNMLPVRLDATGAPTVAQWLTRVQAQALAAQAHQDLPFDRVVEFLQPARSLAHNAIFQVAFAWQADSPKKLALPGVSVGPAPVQHLTSRIDLTLSLTETDGRIRGGIEFAAALFDAATVQRYFGHWRTLLEAMSAGDTTTLDRLPLLSTAQRDQIVGEWNDTAVPFPASPCIHELFEAQAALTPGAAAIVAGQEHITYAELNQRANRLAHRLAGLGVQPGDRIAITLHRSINMVTAVLAALKAGGAYVPLDPAYPHDRLRHMLTDAAPAALLTDRPAPPWAYDLPAIDVTTPHQAPASNPARPSGLTSQHLAYVIYTSGSTGTPKGVMISHGNLVNATLARTRVYEPVDRALLVLSISFDAAAAVLYGSLTCGATLYLDDGDAALDPDQFCREILDHQIESVVCPGPLFSKALACLDEAGPAHSLRHVIVGGGVCPPTLAAELAERHPAARLFNEYGPTEATVWSTVHQCADGEDPVPIGRPVPNARVYVLDGRVEPVPAGVAGELYIGGAGVARGYLNRPGLTAERFVPDPFTGGRMYRTGDLARWLPDGSLEFLGRGDHQVKLRGYRVELGEVEARLASGQDVRECAVAVRGDTLVAYYTGSGAPPESLRAFMASALPDYMVPAAFVCLEALPRTPSGKLDRSALPAPGDDALARREYEAPQGEAEEILAGIWSGLLGVDRVGRRDNFFDLGGHSLLAVTLLDQLRRRGLHSTVTAVFTAATLTDLAAELAPADPRATNEVPPNLITAAAESITPEMLPLAELTQAEIDVVVAPVPGGASNVQDIYPLAPLQEGILFHHLLSEAGDPYLMAAAYAFDSRPRLDAYLRAYQKVVDRHDILRTSVAWEGLREPVQVVWRRAGLPVREVALDTGGGDALAQLRAHVDARGLRLDIRHAPLLRIFIAHDHGQSRWLMLMLLHHLIGDHATLEMIQLEIDASLSGQATPVLPVPFRTFIAQLRRGVTTADHEAFFASMLTDVDEPTAPYGLLRVHGEGSGVAEVRLLLDPELSSRLRKRSRQLGVSVAGVCHLAWAMVLARLTGRDDVVFGTVLFGRMQAGAGSDQAIGPFINTLPLRLSIGGSVQDSVRAAQAALAALLRHEHASLALAQRCSGVPAPAPLFTSLFNFRYSSAGADSGAALPGVRMLGGEERTNYPLAVSVDDLGADFGLTVQAVDSLDPLRIGGYLRRALSVLARALESAPGSPLAALDVLPADERELMVRDWNDTAVPFQAGACFHELFQAQVARTPDAVAVVHGAGQLTYSELDARANGLARHLRGLGVGPDDRVAVCAGRGVPMIVALLGVLKAGGAYVPLDPSYPAARLRYMLADSAPVALLVDGPAPDWADGRVTVDVTESFTGDAPRAGGVTPRQLAYVIYTSGSTGQPKGVMVEHRGVTNFLRWHLAEYRIMPGERILHQASASFDVSVWEMFAPLMSGATMIVARTDGNRDPAYLTSLIREQRVNMAEFVPSMLRLFLAEPAAAQCRSLRQVLSGAEELPPATADMFAAVLPGVLLGNDYGPTETTVVATSSGPISSNGARSRIPIGRPIWNTRVFVLDKRLGLAPPGVAGELYVAGAGLARGYLGRPGLTAERFVACPFDRVQRMYRTGDLARWTVKGDGKGGGELEYLGRADDQVQIRGFRVEPGEVEVVLAGQRGVDLAAVLVREDQPGDKRLVGYVVPADGEVLDPAALREAAGRVLPGYMVPSAVVVLDALPLNVGGKLDRSALPAPGDDALARQEYQPPQGETEQVLAQIWSGLLGADRVGRQDSFFDLGGHSLLAVRLVSRLRAALGVDLPVSAVFSTPVLADLAQLAAAAAPARRPPIIPRAAAAAEPDARRDPKQSGQHAVPIRTTGTAAPLFLAHDGAASYLYASTLADFTGDDIGVYGLPPVPFGDPQLRTIEGMATRMVRLVREVQPHGPYRVAGWGTGGALAYEIAVQLIGQDQPVEFVGMLNTTYTPPQTAPAQAAPEPGAALLTWIKDVAGDHHELAAEVARLAAEAPGLPFEELAQRATDAGLMPGPLAEFTAEEIRQAILRRHLVTEAGRRYIPTPLNQPVTYFSAVEHDPVHPLGRWDEALPGVPWRRIPVPGTHQSMVRLPDAAEVGARLSEAIAQSGQVPATAAAPRSEALNTLQAGRPGEIPLICFPGAGATVVSLQRLTGALDPTMPVYGLQPRGTDGLQIPHATVEAAAGAYLREIAHLTSAGPVHLLGHSYGGWLAFEAALRLRTSGHAVASVTLLDSDAPASSDAIVELGDVDALMQMVDLFEEMAGRPLRIAADVLQPLSEGRRRSLLHERLVEAGLVPPRSTPDVLTGPIRAFTRCVRTVYVPRQAYAGKVNLVLVDERHLDGPANLARHSEIVRGWRPHAAKLDYWHGPGTHMTVLGDAHVGMLADYLRRSCLRRGDADA